MTVVDCSGAVLSAEARADLMLSLIFWMAGFVAGLAWFFKGLRIYRKQRILADTPKSTLLGLAMGFVEVHGKAKPAYGQLVNSPVTGTRCLFYKVEIKGFGEGGEGRRHLTDADGVQFYLEDGTGKVLVDAHGAELDLIRTAWRETGGISLRSLYELVRDLKAPPKFLMDDSELISYAGSLSKSDLSTRRYQFAEYCILPEHWYDVVGTCIDNPEPADVHNRNIIVKGLDMPTFMITWRGEKGIKQMLHARAVKYVFGGGFLAVLSLAFLLSKLKWL